ncbi:MAG: DUF4838 domain-containing protein [Planctomycetes bacterium]|nr:DUF4838 domain-containing protein [Planctomycetota bacterium]
MQLRILTIMAYLLLPAAGLPAGTFTQADGQPYAEIVVAPGAPDMTKLAATEFQTFIKAVTGQELPLATDGVGSGKSPAVYIGASAALQRLGIGSDGLQPEGYRIVVKPGILAIVGRDYAGPPMQAEQNPWRLCDLYNSALKLNALGEAGTLYGVYAFLERVCGIRFYMPGELGTVLSPRAEVKVPQFVTQCAPVFTYRYPWLCILEGRPDEALWFRRAGFGGTAPVAIMHNFDVMYRHREAHPEFFALVDGVRDCQPGGAKSAIVGTCNLCLSNEDMIRQFAADIGDYFDQHPEQQFFPVGPPDGMTRICEEPRCQEQIDREAPEHGKYSNYVWGFVARLANEVAKRHPDKFVGCFAYEKYNRPPTRIDKLPPNVAVMICKQRRMFVLPGEKQRVLTDIAAWTKKASSVYYWDWYIFDNWLPWRGLPVLYSRIIEEDFRWMQAHGIRGEFIEAEGAADEGVERMHHPATQHLNLYLTARLGWDPTLNVQELLDEYFRLFYGPAETEMKEFWTFAETVRTTAGAQLGSVAAFQPESVFTPEVLAKLADLLTRGLAKTPEGSVYRKRIELLKQEFTPARRTLVPVLRSGEQTLELPLLAAPDDVEALMPTRLVSHAGEAMPDPTWIKLGWTPQGLHLDILCFERSMDVIRARCTARDQAGLGDDDCVEVSLQPDPKDTGKSYRYIVNSKGALWDERVGFDVEAGAAGATWNGTATASASVEPKRWRVRLTIPFTDLGIARPAPGSTLRANVFRTRWVSGNRESSVWCPTDNPRDNVASRHGTLILGGQQAERAE